MEEKDYKEGTIPPDILDLLLDLILEVMSAKHGSIMLLDNKSQELTIRKARGLKEEIIKKARVRLGDGISGKVASSGQSVFIKGGSELQLNIQPEDLINPEIDTSYVVPIKLHDGTIGTINISSVLRNHDIQANRESLVRRILYCFSEYLTQVDLPESPHEPPSQLYMMNIFREYSSMRELRVVFDYIFHLTTNLLKTTKKGVFLLKNHQSGFFDLILGYGIDTASYREIYEELVSQLRAEKIAALSCVEVFSRKELFSEASQRLSDEFYIVMPLAWHNRVQGHFFLFTEKEALVLDEPTKHLVKSICQSAARVIEESSSEQRFQELASTDSLTGMYNYGLWWKRLHEELDRSKRLDVGKISLIVLDIDHFDRFNRDHGYFLGDELLRVISDRIKHCLRNYDIAGRIGSDEFGIALPGTDKQKALEVAHRILNTVSDLPAEMKLPFSHALTLSGGITEFPDDAKTPGAMVENAKAVLISAKIMGGNCIKLFEHLEE